MTDPTFQPEEDNFPNSVDDLGQPEPTPCERHSWRASLVERRDHVGEWDDWTCPWCQQEDESRAEAYWGELEEEAISSGAHVPAVARTPTRSASSVDLTDVPTDPAAWEEVQAIVSADPNLPEGYLTPENLTRAQKLSSLNLSDLCERHSRRWHEPPEFAEAFRAATAVVVSHQAHLANLGRAVPFLTYKGNAHWLNLSFFMVGRAAAGKGDTLSTLRNFLGSPTVSFPELGRTPEADSSGLRFLTGSQVTIRGLLGGRVRTAADIEETPSMFEEAKDGLLLFEEGSAVVHPVGEDQSGLPAVMDQLWRGASERRFGEVVLTKSWSILVVGIQPSVFDARKMADLGLLRRAYLHRFRDRAASEAADHYRDLTREGSHDPLVFSVWRAKVRALRLALGSLDQLDISEVHGWIEAAIRRGAIAEADAVVYQAFAIAGFLLERAEYSSLKGTVRVTISQRTQTRLEAQGLLRKELLMAPGVREDLTVEARVEEWLADGRAIPQSKLVERLTSPDVGVGENRARKALQAMTPSPFEETGGSKPLVVMAPKEAAEWNEHLGVKGALASESKASDRLAWREKANELGYEDWHAQREREEADQRRSNRPRPWLK